MTERREIEAGLKRRLGMPPVQAAALRSYNVAQVWSVQCWSCRGKVERKLDELHGPCPHCGVELSKRS